MRRWCSAVGGALVALVVVTVALTLCSGLGVARAVGRLSSESGPDITQVSSHRKRTRRSMIPAYTVYYFGAIVEGMAVSEVNRTANPPDPVTASGRQDAVTYAYGSCPSYPRTGPAAGFEGGCLPPIEIQSAPLCEAHANLYTQPGDAPDSAVPEPHKDLKIKGVPAASFDHGTILQIYTRHTTIAISGTNDRLVRRVADSLRVAPANAIPRVGHVLSGVSTVSIPPIVHRLKPPDARVLRSTKEC